MNLNSTLAALALAMLLAPGLARAGDGHDHGDAAPAPGGPALPRFAAVSESFELVGVLEGRRLALYLDRAADNSPVPEARIELEIAGAKLQATRQGPDAYEVLLASPPAPGVLPITATVTVGQEMDLLAGELDIHEAAHGEAAAPVPPWKTYGGWALGGFSALALSWAGRRALAARRSATGATA
ncbi:conserved exported hypothetical protein [Rubrivivax sp. A210]|uniref:hypothetical protein n=1 Tax=Rubrivivax sp. A210 TaxID=2772301 RepID=UPI001917C6E5|nr:hypothetical protein [Rubrivivax sp. A210]CAD5372713.1 conserved exported hypothetical protein [Rubrivivax sp. A210]